MQYFPPQQAEVPYTGTFVAVLPNGSVSSVENLSASGPYLDASLSGTMAFFGGTYVPDRPLIAWDAGPSPVMSYTANLAGAAWEGISGTSVNFTAKCRRDYVVLLTVMWQGTSANWEYEHFTIDRGLGAGTGVYPYEFYYQEDANARTSWVRFGTMQWILTDLEPGNYTVQVYHSPWGSSLDRTIHQTLLAVL